MNNEPKITTEQRRDDWIAFANNDRRIWEAGRTEKEAVKKLKLRLKLESESNELESFDQLNCPLK